MIKNTTLNTVKAFCKPAVENGLIPREEFSELLKVAKNGDNTQDKNGCEYLTTAEVAQRLHCSTKTVHRMRESGKLRGVFLTDSRKSLRIPEDELELLAGRGGEDE